MCVDTAGRDGWAGFGLCSDRTQCAPNQDYDLSVAVRPTRDDHICLILPHSFGGQQGGRWLAPGAFSGFWTVFRSGTLPRYLQAGLIGVDQAGQVPTGSLPHASMSTCCRSATASEAECWRSPCSLDDGHPEEGPTTPADHVYQKVPSVVHNQGCEGIICVAQILLLQWQ